MSGGESLTIETTALATLALIKASPNSEYEPQIRSAVDWLNAQRSGFGQWSNTQATILGLKAMTAYAEYARADAGGGRRDARHQRRARRHDRVREGPQGRARLGRPREQAQARHNTIELELAGGATLPYSIAVEYRAQEPAVVERREGQRRRPSSRRSTSSSARA